MSYFNMSKAAYGAYVKEKSPNSTLAADMLRAFAFGGAICCIGQALLQAYTGTGMDKELAATLVSITLVFIGALLTGLGVYDDLAKYGGAGTLVPITGFANSVVAPALEFKTEGFVTGTGAKMFIISGPVITYGISASVLYGLILYLCTAVTEVH
ncbi:MAG: SpoVA/SpoVAEb family sporulation membrane protein [Oscillospiraceae bacterium]|jgi:stage V sporulation protein AC